MSGFETGRGSHITGSHTRPDPTRSLSSTRNQSVTQSSRGFCGDRTLRIATENGESGHESEREEKGGEEAEEEADEKGGSGEAAGGRGGEVE